MFTNMEETISKLPTVSDIKEEDLSTNTVEENFDDLSDLQKQVACRMALGEKTKSIRTEFGITVHQLKAFLGDRRFDAFRKHLVNNHLEKMSQLMQSKQKKYIDKIEELADNTAIDGETRIKTWFDLLAIAGVTAQRTGQNTVIIGNQTTQIGNSGRDESKPRPLSEIQRELEEVETLMGKVQDVEIIIEEQTEESIVTTSDNKTV